MFGERLLYYLLKKSWIIYILIISPVLSVSFPQIVNSQYITNRFEHITIKDGFPDNDVTKILKDHLGFLWIGTGNGLVRYDGYNFVTYKHNPNNISSINNNLIFTIYEDKEGVLWVGTWYGLEKFNRTTETFIHYTPDPSADANNLGNQVYTIHEDKYRTFWVGSGNGLYKFDRATEKFTIFRHDSTDPGSLYDNVISWIFEDKEGSLWFGGRGGLDKLNFETGKFEHYWNDSTNRNKVWGQNSSKYWINSIYGDNKGSIWLGTHMGIVEFNPGSGNFNQYIPAPGTKPNVMAPFCTDLSGVLWVAALNGLYAFDIKSKKFIDHYSHDYTEPGSLSSNHLFSVYFDRSGTLWVGTIGGGLNKLNLKKNSIKSYILDRSVLSFIEDKGMLFVNTDNGGFKYGWIKFDPSTEEISLNPFGKDNVVWKENSGDLWFEDKEGNLYKKDNGGNIKYFYDVSGKIFNKPISCVYETKKKFWIGTDGHGLYFLDRTTLKINKFPNLKLFVILIYEDSYGLLWFQTMHGKFFCLNQKQGTTTEFMPDPNVSGSIISREVRYIYEDKKNRLWFATNQGLDKYNRTTKKFIHYLLNTDIAGILEDDHGFLWLATNNGVLKFNPEQNKSKSFDVSNWIPVKYGRSQKSFKAANGEMYFAGLNGFIRFHPDSLKVNKFIPPVVITSFKIFNKEAKLDTDISEKKIIYLPYSENNISFEFAALDYTSPSKNQYAYILEGFDKDWTYCGTRRNVSYTNLDHGSYVFRVKGSNNDGVWNETGTSISIIISPPWWKTTWAYFFYGLSFVITLYGIRRFELKRVEIKDKIKMDEAVLKEREETDRMKSRFFANISHEFRTPLTLINGPVEKIISKSSEEDTLKDAGIIKRNSIRLLQLVNQLLDLSKLESGRLKLEASKNNIVSFVKGAALSFESISEEKDITLKIEPDKEYIQLYFDKEKMLKILSNILSNAFKFTPRNGKITIAIRENDNNVEVKVKDTGIGIPKEEIPKLFDRFYQVDSSFTKEHEGTGIGLALTKELIELHHGNINVESESENPDNGGTSWTEITIRLPLGKEHLKEEEIMEGEKDKQDFHFDEQLLLHKETNEKSSDRIDINSAEEEKTIVLIVEDNYDMRAYIKEALEEDYLVEEAVNGEQGLRKAENIIPDLIISDMMMPKLDGNEMTRILKNDEKTSHIPVIILTAKSGQESKLEGLQTGADDYLTKPFDIRELKIRIENLIKIRKKLQEKYGKGETVHIGEEKKLRKIDEQFLDKVIKIINAHISDENFSIGDFSSEIGMSRTQLHRKLKALVGKSASQYLRSVRLARAKKMIEEEKGNISEIAYSVGFSSPAYFSRCFKEEFGYPPSDLIT